MGVMRRPTLGHHRRQYEAAGIDIAEGVFRRLAMLMLNELARRDALDRLVALHDEMRRGRDLPIVAEKLHNLADDLAVAA